MTTTRSRRFGGLVDQVRRQHDGARVPGEVRQQVVVEHLARHGVEPRVGLVKEGEFGSRREPDDDADGRPLAARHLLDGTPQRRREVLDEFAREVLVPVREEAGGRLQGMLAAEVLGIGLRLVDEAHPAEHRGVLHGRLAEDP